MEQAGIPHAASDVAANVTLSLGVAAMIPVDGVTPDELIRAADSALYAAKENGRNQSVVFTGKIGTGQKHGVKARKLPINGTTTTS